MKIHHRSDDRYECRCKVIEDGINKRKSFYVSFILDHRYTGRKVRIIPADAYPLSEYIYLKSVIVSLILIITDIQYTIAACRSFRDTGIHPDQLIDFGCTVI